MEDITVIILMSHSDTVTDSTTDTAIIGRPENFIAGLWTKYFFYYLYNDFVLHLLNFFVFLKNVQLKHLSFVLKCSFFAYKIFESKPVLQDKRFIYQSIAINKPTNQIQPS